MYLNGSVGQKFDPPFLLRKTSSQKGKIMTFISEKNKQSYLNGCKGYTYQAFNEYSPFSHAAAAKGGDNICL